MIFQAIHERVYEEHYLGNDSAPYERFRDRYNELTIEALDMFVPGEEDEAFWAAVEFHSGFRDPLRFMYEARMNADPDGYPLLSFEMGGAVTEEGREVEGFVLPRAGMLLRWAELRGDGPFYGDHESFPDGDAARHNVVFPNTDVNVDLLSPPIWDIYKSREGSVAPRGLARLMYPLTRAARTEPRRTFRPSRQRLRERRAEERMRRREERGHRR